VTGVAIGDCPPLNGGCNGTMAARRDRPEPPPGEGPDVGVHWISSTWPNVMRVPLKRGRLFNSGDRVGVRKVVLVSETAARTIWPNEDPIGKPVSVGQGGFWKDTATVVGVVGDVRQYGLDTPSAPQAYLADAQQPAGNVALLIRSPLAAQSLAAGVRAAIRGIDSATPVFAVAPMAERIADTLARRRLTLTLFGLFALTALSLAAIGIYGVVSYTVAQHTQALGLRRALGASDARVWQWVLLRGVRHAALGMLIGVPFALAWGRLLASQLVGVSQYDPASFLAGALLLSAIVLAATAGPARRALRVAPNVALRYE